MNKILSILFIIIFSFSGCTKEEKLTIEKVAPSFSLIDINGTIHKLSDYKDKLVILRFWQKGCSGCLSEMSELSDFHLKHQKELVVLAINMGNSMEVIKQLAQKQNLKSPMLSDELKIVTKKYNVKVSPTTFIIDKNGILRKQIIGKLNEHIITKQILSCL